MRTQLEAKDYIAALVIIGLIIFKLTGHNGTLDVAVAIIMGYYFARRQDTQIIVPREEIGKENIGNNGQNKNT